MSGGRANNLATLDQPIRLAVRPRQAAACINPKAVIDRREQVVRRHRAVDGRLAWASLAR